jgi:hypothetical protein
MMRLVACIGLLVFGCADPQSPRCKQVCEREAECIEQIPDEDTRPSFDKRECISDCTTLTRDREGASVVDRHLRCAEAAESCERLLRCP